jgi:hypothetical protein
MHNPFLILPCNHIESWDITSRFTVDHRTRSYSPGASPTTADQIHQHRRALHGIRFTDPLIHHAKAVIDRPRSASPPPSATATVPVPASPTSTAPEQDHSVPRPPHLIRFTDIAVHGTGSASPTRTSTAPKPSTANLDPHLIRRQPMQMQRPRRPKSDLH